MKFYSLNMLLKPLVNVENVDEKYYSILGAILNFINEDEKIYENITISPLWRTSISEYMVKICFFEEDIYKRFFDIMSGKINQTIKIDGLPFGFVGFGFSSKGQVFDLENELCKHYPDYDGIKIEFLSPTVIKSSPYYKLLPIPSIYLYGTINRYNKILGDDKFKSIFGFENTKKIKSLIEDFVIESSYKLETQKIFIKGGYIPANIGFISYSINTDEKQPSFEELKKILPVFINGLRWTGLGFGTRLGLGQVEGTIYGNKD